MQQAEGREPPEPHHFDHGYLRELAGSTDHDPDRLNRAATFMELVGDVTGKSVLDLGGGTTLWPNMVKTSQYDLVDYSQPACDLVFQRLLAAKGTHFGVHCCDAAVWLRLNRWEYDVTLCFGLLGYLPPSFAEDLFRLAPSKVLCVSEAKGQGYLQYETRITAYITHDIMELARKNGWHLVKEMVNPDHMYLRFEKE